MLKIEHCLKEWADGVYQATDFFEEKFSAVYVCLECSPCAEFLNGGDFCRYTKHKENWDSLVGKSPQYAASLQQQMFKTIV